MKRSIIAIALLLVASLCDVQAGKKKLTGTLKEKIAAIEKARQKRRPHRWQRRSGIINARPSWFNRQRMARMHNNRTSFKRAVTPATVVTPAVSPSIPPHVIGVKQKPGIFLQLVNWFRGLCRCRVVTPGAIASEGHVGNEDGRGAKRRRIGTETDAEDTKKTDDESKASVPGYVPTPEEKALIAEIEALPVKNSETLKNIFFRAVICYKANCVKLIFERIDLRTRLELMNQRNLSSPALCQVVHDNNDRDRSRLLEMIRIFLDGLPPKIRIELIKTKDDSGHKKTALHWAVVREHIKVVEMLLEGLPVEARVNLIDDLDGFNETALHAAVERGQIEMVRVLLKGIPLEARIELMKKHRTLFDHTLLHAAARSGCIEMIKILLDGIAFDKQIELMNMLTRYNETILYHASNSTVVSHFLKILPLEAQIALINTKNIWEETDLHRFVERGWKFLLTDILSLPRIDITVQNGDKKTAGDLNPTLFDECVVEANKIIAENNSKNNSKLIAEVAQGLSKVPDFPTTLMGIIANYCEQPLYSTAAVTGTGTKLVEDKEEDEDEFKGPAPVVIPPVLPAPSGVVGPDDEDRAETKVCYICEEPLSIAVAHKLQLCKHIFHENCIHQWFNVRSQAGSDPACPHEDCENSRKALAAAQASISASSGDEKRGAPVERKDAALVARLAPVVTESTVATPTVAPAPVVVSAAPAVPAAALAEPVAVHHWGLDFGVQDGDRSGVNGADTTSMWAKLKPKDGSGVQDMDEGE